MTLRSKARYWTLLRPKYWALRRPGASRRRTRAGAARRSIKDLDLARAAQHLGGLGPASPQLRDRAGLGVHQPNPEIDKVEQSPAPAAQALDVMGVVAAGVELLHGRLG